jgi:hypothetical protein
MSKNEPDSGSVPRPSVNGVRPKKRIRTGPCIDPSGLFMTDTTPTPVPGLSSHLPTSAVIRTKRKAPESDEDPVEYPPLATEQQERPLKKVRVREVPMTDDSAATKSCEHEKAKKDATDEQIEISAAGDPFAREVEERLKKKELKRLKKQERKRKRESGVSDVSMPDFHQESENGDLKTQKPQKKRRRRGHQGTADGTDVPSQATSQSGQSTPPVVKGGKKRSSPAAEYIEAILQSTGRSKRQRTADGG